MVVRNEALVPPRPCRQTSGRPVPPVAIASSPLSVRSRRSSSRPGSRLPLVAARKPTPRWRLRRTDSRPRRKAAMPALHVVLHLRPGGGVGPQQRVGLAGGGRAQRGAAVAEQHVVVAHAGDLEADARLAAGHEQCRGVVAVDQRLERGVAAPGAARGGHPCHGPSRLPGVSDGKPDCVSAMRLARPVRERQMLAVAQRVFAERGFRAASVDEIAEGAEISKPMLYAYFVSKEGLYRACMAALVRGAGGGDRHRRPDADGARRAPVGGPARVLRASSRTSPRPGRSSPARPAPEAARWRPTAPRRGARSPPP